MVTATIACLGLRPAANALGESSGTMYTRGIGSPAVIARFSTMRNSSGASSLLFDLVRARSRAVTRSSAMYRLMTSMTIAITTAMTSAAAPNHSDST